MECQCCFIVMNNRKYKEVSCPRCSFSICVECFKKHLLNLDTFPSCMNCKLEMLFIIFQELILQKMAFIYGMFIVMISLAI